MKKISHLANKELISMLLKQGHQELQYSNLYLSYAYWFDNQNFPGIGNFFKAESESERQHSIKIFDYLNVRGIQVTIQNGLISDTHQKIEKPCDIFEKYCEFEQENYQKLDQIAQVAQKHNENSTICFIQRMLQVQATGCDEAEKILAKAQAYNQTPGLFFDLDAYLNVKGQNFDTWKA